jgi:L-threonylcarbamoyladenylate synthase
MIDLTALRRASDALRAGRLVVIPTDTVYGVAALPTVPGAVSAIFAAKARKPDKPLPVLAAGPGDLEGIVVMDDRARRLADRYWPGPLTLVLPRARSFEHSLGAERDTVAVRVPARADALRLLADTGPLAVTSANRSGAPAALTVQDAREALGDSVHTYLDGGPLRGAPSTILSLAGSPRVLRVGALEPEEVMRAAG